MQSRRVSHLQTFLYPMCSLGSLNKREDLRSISCLLGDFGITNEFNDGLHTDAEITFCVVSYILDEK